MRNRRTNALTLEYAVLMGNKQKREIIQNHCTGYSDIITKHSLPFFRKLTEKANSSQNLAAARFRWIKVALFEKKLQSIVCYIVQEADR